MFAYVWMCAWNRTSERNIYECYVSKFVCPSWIPQTHLHLLSNWLPHTHTLTHRHTPVSHPIPISIMLFSIHVCPVCSSPCHETMVASGPSVQKVPSKWRNFSRNNIESTHCIILQSHILFRVKELRRTPDVYASGANIHCDKKTRLTKILLTITAVRSENVIGVQLVKAKSGFSFAIFEIIWRLNLLSVVFFEERCSSFKADLYLTL